MVDTTNTSVSAWKKQPSSRAAKKTVTSASRRSSSAKKNSVAMCLLSTDTLSGYGLDLIFQTAKEEWFDGIDLAMWKNFDAWQVAYVNELTKKYAIPVEVIQISNKANLKEMNQAVDIAKAVGAKVITINAPDFFNIWSYRFLSAHLPAYKHHNKWIKFSIINPEDKSMLWIIPKYHYSNKAAIIKKHLMYLALDISNVEESELEEQFMKKMANFIPYLSTVYLSDVDHHGRKHLPLGEGVLKLPQLLKRFRQLEYLGYFSVKLELTKQELSDIQKVKIILQKCRQHIKERYEDATLDD